MKLWRTVFWLTASLAGCSKPPIPSSTESPNWSVPIQVDGVKLFVPNGWSKLRPWDPRPWPNGLRIGSGGWGSATPWLGPLEGAERLKHGQFYIYESKLQHKRPRRPDTFFYLKATFELPVPVRTSWWGGSHDMLFFPFEVDQLRLSYRASADEVEQPYRELLWGMEFDAGKDAGDGWREVQRPFGKRTVTLRFDARDWRARGGRLPRRLAASYSPAFWSHYMPLGQLRWSANFETQNLPTDQWRARYVTADRLFRWLQLPPEKRDTDEQFSWWTDLRLRPAK